MLNTPKPKQSLFRFLGFFTEYNLSWTFCIVPEVILITSLYPQNGNWKCFDKWIVKDSQLVSLWLVETHLYPVLTCYFCFAAQNTSLHLGGQHVSHHQCPHTASLQPSLPQTASKAHSHLFQPPRLPVTNCCWSAEITCQIPVSVLHTSPLYHLWQPNHAAGKAGVSRRLSKPDDHHEKAQSCTITLPGSWKQKVALEYHIVYVQDTWLHCICFVLHFPNIF